MPKDEIKTQAIKRLRKIQSSPQYRSFFSIEAIEAFANVDDSAYAGKSSTSVVVTKKNTDSSL